MSSLKTGRPSINKEKALKQLEDNKSFAEILYDNNPEVDPKSIRFTDLRQWVLDLDGFDDDPSKCGERILEAIQLAWIDEYE